MHPILKSIISLFVTIDPLGLIPVFIGLTERMTSPRRHQVTLEAVGFALAIAVGFMFLGNGVFQLLSITVADFKIAGGILLLVLAIIDLLILGKPAVNEGGAIGLFPLAMPLIAGPATLTTTLLLADLYGYTTTFAALAFNFALLLTMLMLANRVSRLVGPNALRAFSKLVMVLLAAIAVNLIRTGIMMAAR